MKKNQKTVISGAIIILMVVVMLGYYYYLSNKSKAKQQDNPKLTAVQEVLLRDLDINYPPTPKEVVKYYSQITKCFYNEEYSDGELEQLADKAKQLYADQLVENNGWGEYIINLKGDIGNFKANEITIASFLVSKSTDVYDFEQDGYEFARLHCIYTLKKGNYRDDLDQVFLLQKDENGHWKIFGWDNAENVDPK